MSNQKLTWNFYYGNLFAENGRKGKTVVGQPQEALYPQCTRDALKNIVWEEGKVVDLVSGIYWYKLVVQCSSMGKQKAVFADGKEHSFFEFARSPNDDVLFATNIVPILPDGRFLMVLEQRGPHALYPERSRVVERAGGRDIELGPYGSLEFPGGAVDPGEGVSSGALRELVEETGIKNQEVELFLKNAPVIAHGAGVALAMKLAVVKLSSPNQEEWVFEDGVKMPIFALTEKEIDWGIGSGSINSGQAVHLGWQFYKSIFKGGSFSAGFGDEELWRLLVWLKGGHITRLKTRIRS